MNNYIDPTKPFGFEIDFLPIGNIDGDAICLRWGRNLKSTNPDQFVMVVDGGYKQSSDSVIRLAGAEVREQKKRKGGRTGTQADVELDGRRRRA